MNHRDRLQTIRWHVVRKLAHYNSTRLTEYGEGARDAYQSMLELIDRDEGRPDVHPTCPACDFEQSGVLYGPAQLRCERCGYVFDYRPDETAHKGAGS